MFVITDADTRTVQERLNILDEALSAAGQTPIDASRDPIARLIPKRNVETWILVLGSKDTAVEEVTDYKSTKTSEEWSALISSAAETLVAWTRPSATLPASLIDSLRRGVGEIPRALPQGN